MSVLVSQECDCGENEDEAYSALFSSPSLSADQRVWRPRLSSHCAGANRAC